MTLGDTDIILGKDWLEEAEPMIEWKDLTKDVARETRSRKFRHSPGIFRQNTRMRERGRGREWPKRAGNPAGNPRIPALKRR
ncbi:hypothetical protein FRC12_018791, partial [Ceratobasidium sp. 428]